MPKTSSKKKPTTRQGAHHEHPLEMMVRRALDSELRWYFVIAEAALRRASFPMLPSYAVVASEPTDEALRDRALETAETIRTCLGVLPAKHAEILRAAYTPRIWPKAVTKAFGPVAPVVVRIALANDPWPERGSGSGLERAVAARLGEAILKKRVPVGRLRYQAVRLLAGAALTYAKVRALCPGALGAPMRSL